MVPEIWGKSVRGASHRRSGKECQDSIGYQKLDFCNAYVLAVADGHGSESCPYSKSGSKIAVDVFCEIMKECCLAHLDDGELLFAFFAREGETKVAQAVDREWKRRVLKDHADNGRGLLADSDIYRQYGSTLVGLLVTPHFVFAFQVGDGDVVFLTRSGWEPVISAKKILGVETDSLSSLHSWRKSVSAIKRHDIAEDVPYAFMLSTDGFSNSYTDEDEYKKSCLDYFSVIEEHGAREVEKHLETWLEETSAMGCGDDISVLFFTAGLGAAWRQ
jgi:serine/threonine protein phosphatase PrpC